MSGPGGKSRCLHTRRGIASDRAVYLLLILIEACCWWIVTGFRTLLGMFKGLLKWYRCVV